MTRKPRNRGWLLLQDGKPVALTVVLTIAKAWPGETEQLPVLLERKEVEKYVRPTSPSEDR